MGLDQFMKFTFVKDEDYKGAWLSGGECNGHFYEKYLRKNYFIQHNLNVLCESDLSRITDDNCMYLSVDKNNFEELYIETKKDLEDMENDKEYPCPYDYMDDVEWIIEDMKEFVNMFETYKELEEKYGRCKDIIYYQWY